jgi:hypothetical protein
MPLERAQLLQEQQNILQWQSAHLKEWRSCMPQFLQEFHSIRQHAAGNASSQAVLARQLRDADKHSLKVHKSKPPPSLEDLTPAPVTEAPVTEAPVTEAPATEAPITEAPATEAPITEAPATEAPITEAPATEAPVTEAPIIEAPATEAPVTESPVVTEAPGSVSLNAAGFKATTSLCCPELSKVESLLWILVGE